MKNGILALILLTLCLTSGGAQAAIELEKPLSPLAGETLSLPENPTELLDKAVDSLPSSEAELKAVGEKIKESLGTETGQKVRAVVKDIGKAFVWATELMVRWIKILLEKL